MANVEATTTFEDQRPHLFGVAYRMLGSVSEAEDIVQDAWLRWHATDRSDVESAPAFLTTVVSRLCLDHLKSARVRRESYVGPWLPEPLVVDAGADPASLVEHADALSMALLVVLESLSPLERAAFVLREVFDYPYDDVAAILDRTPAACRQLVSRALQHVDARPQRYPATDAEGRAVVERFLAACATGDIEALLSLLAEDVVVVSDGGGVVRAARRAVIGAAEAARFLAGISRKRPADATAEIVWVNGGAGLVVRVAGRPYVVMALELADGRVAGIAQVLNPHKLSHLG